MIRRSIPMQKPDFRITLEQSLLGQKLTNCHPETPKRWWNHLRAATCWILWKVCNDKSMGHKDTTQDALLQKLWYRLNLCIRNKWEDLLTLQQQNKITLKDAQTRFRKDFGQDMTVFAFEKHKLLHLLMAPKQRS
jgi:hypothetical protein